MRSPASALLICPAFFSYHLSIIGALEERRYRVTWWNDRPSEASLYKVLLRLFPRQVAPLSDRHFRALARDLPEPHLFEHVLVVKGEALSPATVAALRKALPNARFGFYTWDGVRNVRGALDIVALFDSVATFDPVDARERGWRHRPLFARSVRPSRTAEAPRYDWAFVGTLHSDRYRVLRRLARRTPPGRAYAFMYVPSRAISVLRRLVDWSMWFPGPIRISLAPLPFEDAQSAVASAAAVVDIEHPRQRGLTMRTIETLMAGRKLVTTNRYIRESDLFHPSRICIVDRRDPVIPHDFYASAFEPFEPGIQERYSVAGWLLEVLAVDPPAE